MSTAVVAGTTIELPVVPTFTVTRLVHRSHVKTRDKRFVLRSYTVQALTGAEASRIADMMRYEDEAKNGWGGKAATA